MVGVGLPQLLSLPRGYLCSSWGQHLRRLRGGPVFVLGRRGVLVELRGGGLRVRGGVLVLRQGQVLGHWVAADLLELRRGVVHFDFWRNCMHKLRRGDLRVVG